MTSLSVAIVGAGVGGLAAAAALRRANGGDLEVRVYEQARRFARVGAGIPMMPNSMKVLRGIGIEERLRRVAFAPCSDLNREWDTGRVTHEVPLTESRYGAPYLCMHRGELHDALASAVPAHSLHLGKTLTGLEPRGTQVELAFDDGTRARADAVVGADGVHSIVRRILLGEDTPIRKGRIAYRAAFPAALLAAKRMAPSRTQWSGPERQFVAHYTTAAQSELYFVASVPEPADSPTPESWSQPGDVRELQRACAGFHDEVRSLVEACPECHMCAILERKPLPRWSDGHVVLLGDACHPMSPTMAQGPAASVEDAAILARCFELDGDDVQAVFHRYEAHRKPRTSRLQAVSGAGAWSRAPERDSAWLYGYDAWTVSLDGADAAF